jgi:SsrA-binding protein
MSSSQRLASNRRALRDYFVVERFEAGIELRGTEVKSIREGLVSLTGAYARMENGEAILYGMNVQPYTHGNRFNHEPEQDRRLLLHRREIDLLRVETEQKGHTLIPLAVYLKRGKVKIELGLCRGKQQADKRETLKRETATREADRALREARRRTA